MLKLTLAVLAGLYATVAAAVTPFNGCSFHTARLAAGSWSCAQFNIAYSACTIVHCAGPFCISYPGELFTGYMPDYFIEVTNRAGKSAFTTSDAPLMRQQMVNAANVWKAGSGSIFTGGVKPGDAYGIRTTREHPRAASNYSFWWGRSLQVPYGPLGWELATMGFQGGAAAPMCFTAVTEFAKETWIDDLTASGDRVLATMWAPITAPACTLGAPLLGAVAEIPAIAPTGNAPDFNGCAFQLGSDWQRYMAATGADAYNPAAQCMGVLGGLLPRTGFTNGDDWEAAQRVAWRTASLAQDYWHSGPGMKPGDRWQVLWPPITMPTCFAPGSLTRPTTADPTSVLVRGPGYDTTGTPKSKTEFVYAVWRKRSKCLEPWDAPGVALEISTYQAREAALCAGMNAAAGGP
jgi:hypothetical protein